MSDGFGHSYQRSMGCLTGEETSDGDGASSIGDESNGDNHECVDHGSDISDNRDDDESSSDSEDCSEGMSVVDSDKGSDGRVHSEESDNGSEECREECSDGGSVDGSDNGSSDIGSEEESNNSSGNPKAVTERSVLGLWLNWEGKRYAIAYHIKETKIRPHWTRSFVSLHLSG